MNGASISVVIPCYNAVRYISGTLRSVFAQEWPRLEALVVDDGSSDGSADIIARDFPQVRILRQTNQGVAAARNLGLRHAKGDWVAFIDADDIWLPGKLQAQWQCLASASQARMCYTAWRVWTSQEPVPSPQEMSLLLAGIDDLTRWAGPSGWIYPELLLDCEVWTSTVLARRNLFDEIGVFDADLHIGEDYDLWLRASRVTPILRVPRPYALYRKHPASITEGAPAANYRAIVVERALRRWGLAGPDGSLARKAEVQRALASSWSAYGRANLQAGNLELAWEAGRNSTAADWSHAAGWMVLARAWVRSLRHGDMART